MNIVIADRAAIPRRLAGALIDDACETERVAALPELARAICRLVYTPAGGVHGSGI